MGSGREYIRREKKRVVLLELPFPTNYKQTKNIKFCY